jgi:hypothetical protein
MSRAWSGVDTQARKYSFVSLDEREPREGDGLVADGPLDMQAKALDPSDLHPGRPLELLGVGVVDRPTHPEPMELHVVQLIQANDVDELRVSRGARFPRRRSPATSSGS